MDTTRITGAPRATQRRRFATVSRVTDLLTRLAGAPGLYRGRGDGPESGPFVARIQLATVLRARAVTYARPPLPSYSPGPAITFSPAST